MIRPFRGVHPQIPESAYVDVSAQVIGDVHLGEESSIWCNATLRGDMYHIRIGDRSNVQDNSVIHTRTGSHPTILEEEVTVVGDEKSNKLVISTSPRYMETVLKIIASSSPHLRYVIGQQAKSATLLRQLLPEAIFELVVRNFFSLDKNN